MSKIRINVDPDGDISFRQWKQYPDGWHQARWMAFGLGERDTLRQQIHADVTFIMATTGSRPQGSAGEEEVTEQ